MEEVYARCERECKSEHCDDYGVDYCAAFHNEEEHEESGFCVKAAYLSYGCEICQEIEYEQILIRDEERRKKLGKSNI